MTASNPFIAHRHHLDVYHHALHQGLDDDDYVRLVAEADRRLTETAGHGFVVTPLVPFDAPADAGTVVAKVETGSVGGSHKARHLFGLLLRLLIDDPTSTTEGRPLAIASCGNAALGAAIVARSAARRLRVFVPTNADPFVLGELERLDAEITICERVEGAAVGDPCLHALDMALAEGAEAFTVQGTRVPAVIDGARTIGLELSAQLDELGLEPARIFIQIGGGALATAVMDGLARAQPDGRQPRLHPVQAQTAHPYIACWERARALLFESPLFESLQLRDPGNDAERAPLLSQAWATEPAVGQLLVANPQLMQPWPEEPHSVASGILDDITYDWLSVMSHQIRSGGWPVAVAEEAFEHAVALAARQIDPPPDATGAAGLAGLLTMAAESGGIPTDHGETNVVLLTGAVRPK